MIPFGLTPFRFYAYIGIAVAFAAVSAFGGWQWVRAENLESNNHVLAVDKKSYADANTSNLTTIKSLKESVAK